VRDVTVSANANVKMPDLTTLLLCDALVEKVDWEESAHPRVPAGSAGGGEFAAAGGEGGKPERGAAATALSAWFGKSKAVDSRGQPLKVYHGTQAAFEQFSPEKILDRSETGFFFTDSASMAEKFASARYRGMGTAPGANIRPAYLKIENPLVRDFGGKPKYTSYGSMIQEARATGKDGLILRNIDDPQPGYFYDPFGGIPHDVYIVFRPDQIMPAFGRRRP